MTAATKAIDRVIGGGRGTKPRRAAILRITLDGTVLVSWCCYAGAGSSRPFRDVSPAGESARIGDSLDTHVADFWEIAETWAFEAGFDRIGPWLLYARMPACRVLVTNWTSGRHRAAPDE